MLMKSIDRVEELNGFIREYQKNPNESNFERVYNAICPAIQKVLYSRIGLTHGEYMKYRDDLMQQSVVSLYKALKKVEVRTGYLSFDYILQYIRGDVSRWLRNKVMVASPARKKFFESKKHNSYYTHHWGAEKGVNHGNSDTVEDLDDLRSVNPNKEIQWFDTYMQRNLKPKAYEIFKDYCDNGLTLQEIANKRGVSKQAINYYFRDNVEPVIKRAKKLLPIWSL
jgi:RNA polymerase sigma factor (sigma-70 family)